jgi:ribonuclease P/MRP protein subunit RPP1
VTALTFLQTASNNAIASYDLIAVEPTNDKALLACCKDAEADIIAIDLTERLPFQLKFTTVNLAIQRGIYFEIGYAPCIRGTKFEF